MHSILLVASISFIFCFICLVLSTYKEPVPGWTDNLYGPSGICSGAVRGLVHVIFGNAHKRANLVPADYCINAIIAAAWDINRRYDLFLI